MRTLPQDLRYALRTLGRAPVFSATVLITLTFGLGAATAILGLFDAVVLRPLPYTDPGKLVVLWESNPERGVITNEVSLGNFLDWCDRSRSFEHVTALTYRTLNLTSAVTLVSAWLPVRRAMRLDPIVALREP